MSDTQRLTSLVEDLQQNATQDFMQSSTFTAFCTHCVRLDILEIDDSTRAFPHGHSDMVRLKGQRLKICGTLIHVQRAI